MVIIVLTVLMVLLVLTMLAAHALSGRWRKPELWQMQEPTTASVAVMTGKELHHTSLAQVAQGEAVEEHLLQSVACAASKCFRVNLWVCEQDALVFLVPTLDVHNHHIAITVLICEVAELQ